MDRPVSSFFLSCLTAFANYSYVLRLLLPRWSSDSSFPSRPLYVLFFSSVWLSVSLCLSLTLLSLRLTEFSVSLFVSLQQSCSLCRLNLVSCHGLFLKLTSVSSSTPNQACPLVLCTAGECHTNHIQQGLIGFTMWCHIFQLLPQMLRSGMFCLGYV